jgi:hypothetical protein
MSFQGYKDFQGGEVLDSADLDSIVAQSVMNFASASARTTALSGITTAGMVTYLRDTNQLEVFTGSAWIIVPNANGTVATSTNATKLSGRTLFVQSSAPTSGMVTGDLWIQA